MDHDQYNGGLYPLRMAKAKAVGPQLKWYVREWREKRGLSQEALAELVGTNKGQISKLETQKQRMNDTWVLKWSKALQAHPGRLLMSPDMPTIDDLLAGADPEQLQNARIIIGALVGKKP